MDGMGDDVGSTLRAIFDIKISSQEIEMWRRVPAQEGYRSGAIIWANLSLDDIIGAEA